MLVNRWLFMLLLSFALINRRVAVTVTIIERLKAIMMFEIRPYRR